MQKDLQKGTFKKLKIKNWLSSTISFLLQKNISNPPKILRFSFLDNKNSKI